MNFPTKFNAMEHTKQFINKHKGCKHTDYILLFHCYCVIQLFMNDIVLINRSIKMFSHLRLDRICFKCKVSFFILIQKKSLN